MPTPDNNMQNHSPSNTSQTATPPTDSLDDFRFDDADPTETPTPAPTPAPTAAPAPTASASELEELRRQVAELSAGRAAKPPAEDPVLALQTELDTLEDQRDQALVDGDTTAAAALRKRINGVRGQIDAHRYDRTVQQSSTAASEQNQFLSAVERIEGLYPALNINAPEYDKELTDDVTVMTTGYVNKGMPRAQALEKAVARLMPTAPAAAAGGTTSPDRGLRAATKALDAASRQPPPPDSARVAAETGIDVNKVTSENINKLPADKLAVLRGDYV